MSKPIWTFNSSQKSYVIFQTNYIINSWKVFSTEINNFGLPWFDLNFLSLVSSKVITVSYQILHSFYEYSVLKINFMVWLHFGRFLNLHYFLSCFTALDMISNMLICFFHKKYHTFSCVYCIDTHDPDSICPSSSIRKVSK